MWALNSDIEYLPPPNGPALRWQEKAGWENFELQHLPGGTGSWQRYELPAPHEGLIAWFQGLVRRIGIFLNTEIERPDIDALGADPVNWKKTEIAESSVTTDIWRLIASRNGEAARPITDPFRIQGDQLVAEKETAQPTPTPQSTPPAQEVPLATGGRETLVVGPETPMESAGIKADRHSALLQVAFRTGLGIQGFRLEQGAMVAAIDPKTGIPKAPKFEVIESSDASVELVGTVEGEADGQKFTVCLARINDLPAGSRTYWRLVPSGPKGELPPTTVVLVDTQPLPPFPWNTVLLVALSILLVGILYLRWRLNRPPR